MKIVTDEIILRKKCKKVKEIDENFFSITNDMEDLMNEMDGVGIAAPQVGINERFFLAKLHNDKENGGVIKLFINPIIIATGEEMVNGQEGCLSIPDHFGTVPRYKSITVLYFNGREALTETYIDFDARIIQHEYDHLEGILYKDKSPDFRKYEMESKVIKDEN